MGTINFISSVFNHTFIFGVRVLVSLFKQAAVSNHSS